VTSVRAAAGRAIVVTPVWKTIIHPVRGLVQVKALYGDLVGVDCCSTPARRRSGRSETSVAAAGSDARHTAA
jgi:hypothetical protein